MEIFRFWEGILGIFGQIYEVHVGTIGPTLVMASLKTFAVHFPCLDSLELIFSLFKN